MERIDFLPERITLQRACRRRLVRRGYLLLICVVALVGLGYVRQGRIRKARGQLAILNGRAVQLKYQLGKRGDLEKQLADLLRKKRIDEHLGSRIGAMDVLAELGRWLPKSMSLVSLKMETVELALETKRVGSRRPVRALIGRPKKNQRVIKRIRLELSGVAPNDVALANFIGQLSASRLFEDVKMGYAKNVEYKSCHAREFRASCYVVR